MMRPASDELGDFRLADVLSFLAVRSCGSITAAARELKVTPSQVSKSIARLEAQLHLPLLNRSARGVSLSDAGARVVPHLEEVVARWRMVRRVDKDPPRELAIAAPSYLGALFVPRIAASMSALRLRHLEMPPPLIRALVSQNIFDLFFALGHDALPESWTHVAIGEVRKALFAAPALARRLGRMPVDVEQLAAVPFISPIHSFNGQFVPVDDGCPLKFGKRRLGHEVLTILLALEMASSTEQLVFGPAIAAHRYLQRGLLVEVKVRGWHVSETLHLACNGARVLSSDQKAMVQVMRAVLRELTEAEGPAAQDEAASPVPLTVPLN